MTNTYMYYVPQWEGILYRRIPGPQAPDTIQKQILSNELSSTECDAFHNHTMLFGNNDGINILTTLENHARILDAHSNELRLLRPYKDQITLIRRLVLERFSGTRTMHDIRWQRNTVAHGGRIITDIQIIKDEEDDYRRRIWTKGFYELYGIGFNYAYDIMNDHFIQEISNIHADGLSLDIYIINGGGDVVSRAAQLIDVWKSWADNKTGQYPFRDPLLYNMLLDFFQSA